MFICLCSHRMPRWFCPSALRVRAKSATTALNRKGLKNNPPILLARKSMAITINQRNRSMRCQ